MTELAEDPPTILYASAGGVVKLKNQRKSVSQKRPAIQRRCFSVMTTTCAAGDLLCTIVIVKDSSFKTFSYARVRSVDAVQ